MPDLLRATGDLQELIEFQDPPLTAGPTFAAFVEDGRSRVVDALHIARSRGGIFSAAALPATCRVLRNLRIRIIRVGLFDDGLCGGIGRALR